MKKVKSKDTERLKKCKSQVILYIFQVIENAWKYLHGAISVLCGTEWRGTIGYEKSKCHFDFQKGKKMLILHIYLLVNTIGRHFNPCLKDLENLI